MVVTVFYLCAGSGSADKSGGVQCQKQTLSGGNGAGLELHDGDGDTREDGERHEDRRSGGQ